MKQAVKCFTLKFMGFSDIASSMASSPSNTRAGPDKQLTITQLASMAPCKIQDEDGQYRITEKGSYLKNIILPFP